jgi:hypothetical protein
MVSKSQSFFKFTNRGIYEIVGYQLQVGASVLHPFSYSSSNSKFIESAGANESPEVVLKPSISDHQQSWGYEVGPSKGPGPRSADGR